MKTIGIVGSRRRDEFTDNVKCLNAVKELYQKDDRFVSGGCPKGADRFAESIAKRYGATITIHYPDWDSYGNTAALERNTLIARDCDVLIAVVAPDGKGGTEDTIRKATKMGKQIVLVE